LWPCLGTKQDKSHGEFGSVMGSIILGLMHVEKIHLGGQNPLCVSHKRNFILILW
jgi:hypothetical protein